MEDLTPLDCERKLRAIVNEMSRAEKELRLARDKEIDKKHEYQAAKRAAFLSKDCPRPTRGGYTVADREVWVDDQAAKEERDYDTAVARRQDAKDHLDTVKEQANSVQSLLRSAWKAFELGVTTQHEGV